MKAVHNKILATILTGTIAIGTFAGCGSSGTTSADTIRFLYDDDSYTAFFEQAAADYEEQTGVKVAVELRGDVDYIGDIYDETIQDENFPDVYLIQSDNLAEAYLYGLVAVNEKGVSDKAALHAADASEYNGVVYGYPLSYNTTVFVYQNGFFESEPETIESIITYSEENDPPEDVEYLLEWDVNDPFYDFMFIGNSVTFIRETDSDVSVSYDEEVYQADLEYFEEILESFSIDADTVSEDSIISNFLAGRTLCAVIDTDLLGELSGYDYSLMAIPNLSGELASVTCAATDLIVVNDFSESTDAASDFAQFVTEEMAGKLYDMTGHYSVMASDGDMTADETVAREVYENSVLMPDARDAKDFWVNLKETILTYF